MIRAEKAIIQLAFEKYYWKVDGRKIVVGKGVALRGLSRKINSRTWEGFTRKGGGYQCINHENVTMHRCLQEMSCSSYIPNIRTVLKQRRRQKNHTWTREKKYCSVAEWPKVFFLDESKLCISFEHQGPSVEEEWSCTVSKVFEVRCEASAVCDDLGCRFTCWCWRRSGPLCFNKSKSTQHLPGGHFIPPPPDKLYGDTNFPLQQDLAPSHSANLHGPNTAENLWSIIMRKKRNTKTPKYRWAEGFCQSNTGFNNTHWLILRHILII